MPASYACPYHRMWWVVFHRNRVVRTLFDPKTFKDRKLRKIANPPEKRTFPHNKHIVRNISHVSIAEFVCKCWLKLLHCQVLLRVARHGRTRYSKFRWLFPCGVVGWWKLQQRHKSLFGILADCS
jgi:hypothetical protein